MTTHFKNPVNGTHLKVTIQIVGPLQTGKGGYCIHVWEMPYWNNKETIAVATVDFEGNLQPRESDKNAKYYTKNKLSGDILYNASFLS